MVVYYAKNGTPDNSQAKSNAGTFPRRLTKTEFMDTWLASGLTATRYGVVIKAMKDSSDGDVIYAYERYVGSKFFDKTLTESLTSTLVTKSIMTSDERTALLNAWVKD
tara:strand:- start:561 stop:884 length:324 start_codon:yes stop_codon:yes gene_type:complete